MFTQPMSDSDSGWSSEDEWNDSAHVEPVQSRPEVPRVNIEDAKVPVWPQDRLESLPVQLSLIHFIHDETGHALFRCEPANKHYPGISFDQARSSKAHVSVRLFNSKSQVQMRTPDIKTKGLEYIRTKSGIIVDSKGTIHFKKKCLDKHTKKDLAFELGKSYLSHTGGITPQFVFVAVPFENGAYAQDKAFRSPPFRVFSKRQERFLQHKHKRQKTNVEIEKLNTDIDDAETTKRSLTQELRRLKFMSRENQVFFDEMRNMLHLIQNPTVKTALQYALRQDKSTEVATL